jgi:lipopolysaccharide/colanic/teichoic acid biosynthesis glycosyltransferase
MKHEDSAVFAAKSEFIFANADALGAQPSHTAVEPSGRLALSFFKRTFDILMSLALLPVLLVTMMVLLVANRSWNSGPLFYRQSRMGRDCKPFVAIKLRTMKPADEILRSAHCPLEHDRITPLGKFLRKSRLDELPQLLNVLKGDMSMIGPRPDYYEHAKYFLENVPGYRERHSVRPGISGLAQTELGYIEGVDATRKKVDADLFYIENRSLRMETWILWRTIAVVAGRGGA